MGGGQQAVSRGRKGVCNILETQALGLVPPSNDVEREPLCAFVNLLPCFQATLTTTLPFARPDMERSYALWTSAKGKTSSTMGLRVPVWGARVSPSSERGLLLFLTFGE